MKVEDRPGRHGTVAAVDLGQTEGRPAHLQPDVRQIEFRTLQGSLVSSRLLQPPQGLSYPVVELKFASESLQFGYDRQSCTSQDLGVRVSRVKWYSLMSMSLLTQIDQMHIIEYFSDGTYVSPCNLRLCTSHL